MSKAPTEECGGSSSSLPVSNMDLVQFIHQQLLSQLTDSQSVDQAVQQISRSDYESNNEVLATSPRRRGRPPLTPTTTAFMDPSTSAKCKIGNDSVIDFGLDYPEPKHRFKCNICNAYSAKKRYDVLRHIRYIHTHEKVYSCLYCDKSFAASGALRKHERRHKGLCSCNAKERVFMDQNGGSLHWAHCFKCKKPISQAIVDQKIKNHTLWRDFVRADRTMMANPDSSEDIAQGSGMNATNNGFVPEMEDNADAMSHSDVDTPQHQTFTEVPVFTPQVSTNSVSSRQDSATEQPLPSSPVAMTHPTDPPLRAGFVRAPTQSTRDAQDILIRVYDVLDKSSSFITEPSHECVICQQMFISPDELMQHYISHASILNSIGTTVNSN